MHANRLVRLVELGTAVCMLGVLLANGLPAGAVSTHVSAPSTVQAAAPSPSASSTFTLPATPAPTPVPTSQPTPTSVPATPAPPPVPTSQPTRTSVPATPAPTPVPTSQPTRTSTPTPQPAPPVSLPQPSATPTPAPPAPPDNMLIGAGIDTAVTDYSDCTAASPVPQNEAAIYTCVTWDTYFLGHNPGVFTPLLSVQDGTKLSHY